MAMLHIVNKSVFERGTLDSCLKTSLSGSSILFIEDAVVSAVNNTSVSDKIKSELSSKNFYVLTPDLNARGFTDADLIEGIKGVDYDGFVDLVTDNSNVQSWL